MKASSPILDMTAGSRMMWFDKHNPDVTFVDKYPRREDLPTGHHIDVDPDIVGDFRNLEFDDNQFSLVIFDPPHLLRAGKNSWLRKKYGVLSPDTWKDDMRQGFDEAMRVLKPFGTLVFKWNEDQIGLPEILRAIPYEPLAGQKRTKTQWLVFMKLEAAE